LSESPVVNFNLYKEFKSMPWNMRGLSRNPNITFDIVEANKDVKWDHVGLSENPNLTYLYVKSHPEIKWDYSAVCANPGIKREDLTSENASDSMWCWDSLGKNPNIPLTVERINPEMFSYNPNISLDYISNHMKVSFDWCACSKNINIDTILKNKGYAWKWEFVTINPSVSFKTILDNPREAWDYSMLSMNPNITLKELTQIGLDKVQIKHWKPFLAEYKLMLNSKIWINN
jgi:hypothetical protein